MKTRCISGVAGALALSAAVTLFAQTPAPAGGAQAPAGGAQPPAGGARHLLAARRHPLAVVAAAGHSCPRPSTRPISRSKW